MHDSSLDTIVLIASGLPIGDGDDKHRFAQSTSACRLKHERFNHPLPEHFTDGCQASKLDLGDKLGHLLLATNVVTLLWSLHESDLHTVIVEKRSCKCDAIQDDFEILNSLSTLIEGHGTTVIDVQHNVVKCQLHDVLCSLAVY